MRRRAADLLVFAGYAAVSFAFLGWPLLPHPGRPVVGATLDPPVFVWAFGWWPHAIASWTNPFVTHALYAPNGLNLAWTVTVPALALAFSPLTVIVGPTVSYNVAMLLMPALAAWTAYFLCRYLTGARWPAVAAGFVFGFSGSVLREEKWGNLHTSAIFVLPLIALVVVRHMRNDLSPRGLAWRLGALVAVQFAISTEFALSATVVLAICLALAYWLLGDLRPRVRSALAPVIGGYALAAVFAAPLVVYALLDFVSRSFVPVRSSGTDLLSAAVPMRLFAIGGSWFTSLSDRFPDGSPGAYLGMPTLLIIVAWVVRSRRSPSTRFLVAALGVVALITLGTELIVAGHRLFPLPWSALSHLPGLSNALPYRFTAYLSLGAAVIVALWTAGMRGWFAARPAFLPILAMAALIPPFWHTDFRSHPQRFAFFTSGVYKTCFPANETVAIFPFIWDGYSILWQAESGFRFRLAADGLQPPLRGRPLNSFDADPVVDALNNIDVGRPTMDTLLAFAATHHIDRYLALDIPGFRYPSRAQMRAFGPVRRVGRILVAPGCGRPSLRTRNLTSYVEKFRQISNTNIGYCSGGNFNELPAFLYPSGPLAGATIAIAVSGKGLTCSAPPPGFKRKGFATAAMGVPPNTYPFYAP